VDCGSLILFGSILQQFTVVELDRFGISVKKFKCTFFILNVSGIRNGFIYVVKTFDDFLNENKNNKH
jgi:hypothetical protein